MAAPRGAAHPADGRRARRSAPLGLLLVVDLAGGTTSLVGVLWALVAMVGAAFYFVLSSRDVDGLPGTALAAGGLLVGGSPAARAG